MQTQSLENVMSNTEISKNFFQETLDSCKTILQTESNFFLKSKNVANVLESYMTGSSFYPELPKIQGFVFLNNGRTLKLHIEVGSIRNTVEFNQEPK